MNTRFPWATILPFEGKEPLGMHRCAELDYPDADYPPQDNPTMVYRLEAAEWRTRAAAEATRADV